MADRPNKANAPSQGMSRRNLFAAGGSLVAGIVSRGADAFASRDGDDVDHHHYDKNKHHHRPVVCFAAGTLIATPDGEAAIETLQVGDRVLTCGGKIKPIRAIGRRRVERDEEGAWEPDHVPVLIRRSAIDDNVPCRDLRISKEHALFLDGVLIPARRLLNGATILEDVPADNEAIEYFHIGLGTHEVILAEGAPCETLCDCSLMEAAFDVFVNEDAAAVTAAGPALYAPTQPGGRKAEIKSRLRSALSPWFDLRTPFDKARDRLEERATILHP